MATRVYLGVGSNLNRENALRFAVAKIGPLFKNFQKSSVWISHPVRQGEPDYYNMVLGGDTEASLEDLYACLQKVEQLAGGELMFNNGTNFGIKRRLDIDILVFGDTIATKPCKLPRHDIFLYLRSVHQYQLVSEYTYSYMKNCDKASYSTHVQLYMADHTNLTRR